MSRVRNLGFISTLLVSAAVDQRLQGSKCGQKANRSENEHEGMPIWRGQSPGGRTSKGGKASKTNMRDVFVLTPGRCERKVPEKK